MDIQIVPCSIECEKKEWVLFVCMAEGRVVGSCELTSVKENHPMLGGLHVDPAHRRRGIAIELIKRCIGWCAARNKAAISLTVSKENVEALALYRRMGFCSYLEDEKLLWMGYSFDQ